MTYFYDRLEEIKKHGSIDFLKIKFGLGEIVLKLVDTSDETVSLLYNLRKKYRKMFATDFEMTEDKTRNWINNLIIGNPEQWKRDPERNLDYWKTRMPTRPSLTRGGQADCGNSLR